MSTPAGIFTSQVYEHDPRWTAVDSYTLSHLHPPNTPLAQSLTHALEHSFAAGLPDIAVFPAQGKFLALQARLIGARHLLELGTLGGYSTIWLASSNPDARVTTVEVSEAHAKVAKENFAHAGVADRVEVKLGKGLDVLPGLLEEVQAGKRPKFDFFFIDADKENGWNYFDYAVKLARPGAVVFVDNVVRRGELASEEIAKTNSRIRGSRELVEKVGKDERVDAVVLQTVAEKNYDGFLMAIVQ